MIFERFQSLELADMRVPVPPPLQAMLMKSVPSRVHLEKLHAQ